MELRNIDINEIKPNIFQPRTEFEREKLKELAESILSNGLINPITVRKVKGKRKYEIVAGERRWRAHKLVGLKKINAFVKEYDNEGQMAVESLLENIHREDLMPLERAKFLKKIADMENIYHIKDGKGFASHKKGDIDISALARRVNMKRELVSDDLSLLGFEPREVKDVPVRALVRIASVKDKKLKKQLLKKAKGDKTTDEINKIVSITRNADEPLKKALLNDEIDVKQAERIVKLPKDKQIEAIQEHKKINIVSNNVERSIGVKMSAKQKKALDKKLVQSKNLIVSFRGSVTDCYGKIERAIKNLMLCTKFIPIMDDKQKELLNSQLDRFIEILEKGLQLSEQIKEKI